MKDLFDQTVSTASANAARLYDQAVDAQLHAWPGALTALQGAMAEAPDFALPHALHALLQAGRGDRAAALRALARAQQAVAGATERERSQVALFTAVIEGRTLDALGLVVAHTRAHPADLLAASTALGAYGLFAFSGRADHDAARLHYIEALALHHPDNLPWLLAQRGWARIEAGRVGEGLVMAQHALALRPANGGNAHVIAHGLFESDDHAGTLAFIDRWLPGYPGDGVMWGHLHWHAALAELALGRDGAARARLQGPIAAYLPQGLPFMGLPDVVSLLWRLGLRGQRGLPWALAQAHVERHFPQGSNVFGELHLALLAAARGDAAGLAAVTTRVQALLGRGMQGAAVVLQLAAGLSALARGDEAAARSALDAACAEAVRVGGSHAQRQVLPLTAEAGPPAVAWGLAQRA
jgi:tetratricopeptide (TPR) repeat protein